MKIKFPFLKSFLIIVFFALFFGILFLSSYKAEAIGVSIGGNTADLLEAAGLGASAGVPVRNVPDDIRETKKGILDTIWAGTVRAANIFYKNALRTFLSRLAYDTATRIAEGGVGQSPLFHTKTMTDFLSDVGETTLVDTLDILAKDNGFFEFDICQPKDLNLKLAIHYSLFNQYSVRTGRGAPRCSLSEIASSWTEWRETIGRTYSTENFLDTMRKAFTYEESEVGIYLTLDSSIRSRIDDEKTKQLFDRVANQNFKAVSEPISGFIKTPAAVSKEAATQLASDKPISENVRTGDIVADSVGIFTNTLASKLLKQLFEKGLTEGSAARDQLVYNWASGLAQRSASEQLAQLAVVQPTTSRENILEYLTSCAPPPCADDQTQRCPGPTDCVVPQALSNPIEDRLTVRDIMDRFGSWYLGYSENGTPIAYDSQSNFSYRSLLIMRQHGILPVGWELAAQYAKLYNTGKTLNELVHCFEDPDHRNSNNYPEDCRLVPNDDESINPYYHLVDPNWVLKAPVAQCNMKGNGYQVLSQQWECLEDNVDGTIRFDNPESEDSLIGVPACGSEYENSDIPVPVVARSSDYCADWQTCLNEDENGNCEGDFGYCLKYQPIWRLEGETCDPQFASCETFVRSSDNKSFSYLENTLEACPSNNDAGCMWYSTNQELTASTTLQDNVKEWLTAEENRIYLNASAESCDQTGVGCTKLTRMLPGVNLAFNGNFELNTDDNEDWPDGWEKSFGGDENCEYEIANNEGMNGSSAFKMTADNSETCSSISSGFIPVDQNFTYNLTLKMKSESSDQRANICIEYFNENKNPQGISNCNIFSEGVNLSPAAESWQTYSAEVQFTNVDTEYLKIKLMRPISNGQSGYILYDDLQLGITESAIDRFNLDNFFFNSENYRTDYSQNNSYARQYLKVAPEYLACDGFNDLILGVENDTAEECLDHDYYWRSDINFCVASGDSSCLQYATVCQAEEVGCQGYTPANGDPEVSGVATTADACPNECVGYDSYLELTNYFEEIEDETVQPIYRDFIPATGQSCSAVDAGCEQFTNLDEVAEGGEGIEYFTYLRQCIQPNNPDIEFYFTWEGSDTTGYQLKRWEMLRSSLDDGPCTNVELGAESCIDTPENQANCSAEDVGINPDCRDFFNPDEDHFYRLQSRIIKASGDCKPYRRTATGTVFNADPSEGQSCAPQANGCTEYRGNAGNNVRNIFNDTFGQPVIGAWQNTANTTVGLNPSNESIIQGGYSLKVSTANRIVARNLTGQLSAGKLYTLSFIAKKGSGSIVEVADSYSKNLSKANSPTLINKALAQTETTLFTFEKTGGLTNDWQQYTIGPLELGEITGDLQLRLKISGLSNLNEIYYVDDLVLKEFTDNFYLIKDSWNTPGSCDLPGVGAQLGCQLYTDRQGTDYSLKSFSSFCSSSAIGCEAYLDTQNSSYYQSAKAHKAVCDVNNGEIIGNTCYIRGEEKCPTGGSGYCEYDVTTVANDEIVYLVNDPNKECGAGVQGCSLLGQPELDQQVNDYTGDFVLGFRDVYKINNPDNYNSSLCSEAGLFCQEFSGEISGKKAYFDPAVSDNENANSTCYFSPTAKKWLKSGTGEECTDSFYLPEDGGANYEGLVGLCPASQSSCTEYRDAETVNHNINEKPEYCDASLPTSPEKAIGLVAADEIVIAGDTFRVAEIDNAPRYVCKENTTGEWGKDGCKEIDGQLYYTSYEWYCILDTEDINNNENVPCCLDENGSGACDNLPADADERDMGDVEIPETEVQACTVKAGQQVCSYSLACEGYNYLSKSLEGNSDCTTVDREAGCALFNDTSNPSLNLSNRATDNGQAPFSPADCSAQNYADSKYCDANLLLKVSQDRQCSEWLACGTEIVLPDGSNSCYGLVRCTDQDGDNCTEVLSVSEEIGSQDFSFNDDIEQVRNLSGYSKVSLSWPDGKTVGGYSAPEKMTQVGQSISLNNPGFERFSGEIYNPEINGWPGVDIIVDNTSCNISIETVNVFQGRYSVKINMDSVNDESICYINTGTDLENLYKINSESSYAVSYNVKSSSGDQISRIKMNWFDADGVDIGNDSFINIPTFNNRWRRNVKVFDPPDDASYFSLHLGLENESGDIYYDDIKMEPALMANDETYIGKECRLYPDDDSPACSYQSNVFYQGLNGYCLEPDPFYFSTLQNQTVADWSKCLQWYPVDTLSGESNLNYTGDFYDQRVPLYYCLQSKGLARFSEIDNNRWYGYYQWDRTRLSADGGDDACQYDGDFNGDFTVKLCSAEGEANQSINIDDAAYGAGISDLLLVNFECVSAQDGCGVWPSYTLDPERFQSFIRGNNYNTAQEYNLYNDNATFKAKRYLENNKEVWYVYRDEYADFNCDDYLLGCNLIDQGFGLVWFKLYFNLNGILTDWYASGEDVNGGENEYADYKLSFRLKEKCEYIAQVVDENGLEKTWIQKFNSGWKDDTNYLKISRDMINSEITARPYGSFIQPDNFTEPGDWPDIPLVVKDGNFGNLSAGLPYSTSVAPNGFGRTCVSGDPSKLGDQCNSSDDCGDDINAGVCMGIGNYCYRYDNYRQDYVTYGQPCSNDDQCEGTDSCAPLGYGNNLSGNVETALGRIQNLFAEVYGIWEWNGSTYEEVADGYVFDISGTAGLAAFIQDAVLEENGQPSDGYLPVPGGLITLKFKAVVNANQLPIEKLKIDWGNGEVDFLEGPLNSGTLIFNKNYTCVTNASHTSCIECSGGVQPNVNGECIYDAPKVNFQDNWGWCADNNNGFADDYEEDNCYDEILNIFGNETITVGP